uniref:NADH-ubiquinone oxidoreductase chain 4 n=1 Tax=Coelophrys brevicaudata TaxID=412625 RepID=D3KRH5_COEBR|nr:NADH dehydrogenase subunit 4 [Coelophrys brevicaudata]BAI77062.1 NADH dehydrogenase subunit 4 [Coelophrys brevicaudata]
MLKILVPTLALIPTLWLICPTWLWTTALAHSLIIASLSLPLIGNMAGTGWSTLSLYLAVDSVSAPLIVLTCWLLPLMILASQNHMSAEPLGRQRMFLSLLALLQFLLILAFSATELIMFYVMFEATLIPTLVLITRWGTQKERLSAGTYFLLYTLLTSLPLLVALLILQNITGTLSLLTLNFNPLLLLSTHADKLWWAAFLLAFLVKMPMYGTHLWLPKAHVEAPVAGSMILAAVLLKLGGYGLIRILLILEPLTQQLSYPFMILSLWGIIMTSAACLRQTDLKSLIAYSSVSHMGLVVGGIFSQSPWGLAGATALMIAHGLTSSALFCLANIQYERTHNRTLVLARGLQSAMPLLTTCWLIATLANLGLPPFPNFLGEIMAITALYEWSPYTLIMTGAGTVLTAAYSLYLFLMSQRGPIPEHLTALAPVTTREHLLMILHLGPLTLLALKPELVCSWTT